MPFSVSRLDANDMTPPASDEASMEPIIDTKDATKTSTAIPSALWKAYRSKGAKCLNAYDVQRVAGANKSTEVGVQKFVREEYFSVRSKNQGINTDLREYMSELLGIPPASMNTYSLYEGWGPPDSKPLSLQIWMIDSPGPPAYTNFFDCETGVIIANNSRKK